jgi:hypothetical protein
MRSFLFYAMAGSLAAILAGWTLWMIGRAFYQLLSDWKLGKELDELQADTAARRQRKQESLARRLASGCDHDFTTGAAGLPPDACSKCGIEKDRPDGLCDHVWRVRPGAAPSSVCEQCGKVYQPMLPSSEPPRR